MISSSNDLIWLSKMPMTCLLQNPLPLFLTTSHCRLFLSHMELLSFLQQTDPLLPLSLSPCLGLSSYHLFICERSDLPCRLLHNHHCLQKALPTPTPCSAHLTCLFDMILLIYTGLPGLINGYSIVSKKYVLKE